MAAKAREHNCYLVFGGIFLDHPAGSDCSNAAALIDRKGRLVGMITDGDLRRHMGHKLLEARVGEIMTKKPNTLTGDMLASAALQQINALKRTQMFVVDKGKPVGVVHVHDLLRAGVA